MKLIFLGTGTSQGVPVIGCQCKVCLSEDRHDKRLRSAVWIENDAGTKFLIDIGPDFRQQMLENQLNDVDAVLLTHEHNDHVAGLDDIRSINFLQKKNMPFYAIQRVLDSIEKRYDYIFSSVPYPGLPRIELKLIDQDHLYIEEQKIDIIQVMHGSLPIVGFRIGPIGYITDASQIADIELDKLKDLKILVLNALRQEKHFSHYSLPEAIEVAQKLNAEHTFLTHLSHRMGKVADILPILPKNISLAYDGLILEA